MRLARLSIGAVAALMVAAVVTAPSPVHADLSKKLLKKYKGKLLITEGSPLSTQFESDADAIKVYDKATKTTLKSFIEDGVPNWSFYFLAIMKKKPGVTQLSLDFYLIEGKKKLYVANKRLGGVEPGLTLLSTRVQLSEDDGLNKNRTYLVQLVAQRGKREHVLATANVTTK